MAHEINKREDKRMTPRDPLSLLSFSEQIK
jgi:hypothetical protein